LSQFHPSTDTERREAAFWGYPLGGRLIPGQTLIEGIEKENLPCNGPKVYADFVKRWTCTSDLVVVGTDAPSILAVRCSKGVFVMAALDWSKCEAVEGIPGKVSGAWVFKGTRLPVATVIENLEDLSIAEITEQFDVTREQITAVLDFIAETLRSEPVPASARPL
jgi:uncharacterized protein (DUF433 family)